MSVPNRKLHPAEPAPLDVMQVKWTDVVASAASGLPPVPPEPDRFVHARDALTLCMLDGCVGG